MKGFIKQRLREELNNHSIIWYHGANEGFNEFKIKNGSFLDANYNNPIFLTSNYEFAKAYAGYKTPFIYKIKLSTNNIFDYRLLPSAYDIIMYEDKNIKKPNLNYNLGIKLYNDILNEEPKGMGSDDPDRIYNLITGGHYQYMERPWFFDWLKKNKFDGAYVKETDVLNVFIFNINHLKIIGKEKLH